MEIVCHVELVAYSQIIQFKYREVSACGVKYSTANLALGINLLQRRCPLLKCTGKSKFGTPKLLHYLETMCRWSVLYQNSISRAPKDNNYRRLFFQITGSLLYKGHSISNQQKEFCDPLGFSRNLVAMQRTRM